MPIARTPHVSLAYEVRGEGTPLLLVMGLGAQMIVWPDGFCDALVDRGFCVVRFDNRDVGASSRMDALGVPSLKRSTVRWLLRQRVEAPYQIGDLASDTEGLLDALEWPTAHVVGASMGGMVAQQLAVQAPERVRSLTSIMSHGGDRRSVLPHPSALAALLGPAPQTREAAGAAWVKLYRAIGSPGFDFDEQAIFALGAASFDRGPSPRGFVRQFVAVLAAHDRRAALAGLGVPMQVIHGSRDRLVRPGGARRMARSIPGARLIEIPGMGHDLPRGVWTTIADAIWQLASRAEGCSPRRRAPQRVSQA